MPSSTIPIEGGRWDGAAWMSSGRPTHGDLYVPPGVGKCDYVYRYDKYLDRFVFVHAVKKVRK